jgi:hypothetical protein
MATRFQRAQWNPILPIALFVLHIVLAMTVGITPLRIAGFVVIGLWSGLAIYNWRIGGKFVERLYDP